MSNNMKIGELIPIENRNGQQAVNARHLYVWLGVRKDFSNWIKAQIIRCDLTENQDFEVFAQKVENSSGGRPSTEYALSLNAAKEISMMSQTEKGKEARRYFIECERIAKQNNCPALPTTYKEALTQLLSQVEQNEKLQEENARLLEKKDTYFKGLVVAESLIKDQKKIIREKNEEIQTKQNIINLQSGELDTLIPKGKIYDQVMQTPNDVHLSTTSNVANEIGMSAQKLNKILVACGIIYQEPSGDYLFTSEYIGWGLGRAVSTVVNEAKGLVKTYIKWNTRGRAYIHALYDTDWDKRRAWHLLRNGRETTVANI